MAYVFWLFLLIIIIPVRAFIVEPFSIPSSSMSPTLNPGDTVVIKKWGYGSYGTYGVTLIDIKPTTTLKHGEVLVFRFPEKETLDYIKRVVGLPGDEIRFAKDILYVNGKAVEQTLLSTDDQGLKTITEALGDETYNIFLTTNSRWGKTGTWTVPEDSLFVMGDNRHRSNDSRYWGFVPTRNVVGKLVLVF